MRIAVLTNDYPPQSRGGAGIIADLQVRELRRRGHEVKVFTSIPEWTSKPPLVRLFRHLADLKADRKLCEDIYAWKPEMLLTHNLTGCGIGTPDALKVAGIPWVHVLHDVQLVEPSGAIVTGESFLLFRSLWRRIWSSLRRNALGNPTAVVSPTQWLIDFHRRWGLLRSSKTVVIPNPVEIEDEGRGSRLHGNDKGILFVGRLDVEKGIDVLMQAWEALGDDAPPLSLVGDGKRRAAIEARKDPRLTVYGPQPHGHVLELMRSHAILVVPSLLIENQPTVILEGLASGCEVIASDVGGIPETLGDAGRIVRAGDTVALMSALVDTMASKDLTTGREGILARHRVDVSVGALESVLMSNR
ncbi:glycosyltransferase [Patescibacteria group bacterium]|nr:glycosyltransferase [Patescibacteria group bacterium]MBU1448836.1 glycosyltransferase [Patescibacteria group bacterium]MBU2613224.1 glycosyltransferase [Patescibacteria group bacterium]